MDIELTEVQILRLEDGDVLLFRTRAQESDEAMHRLQAAVDHLVERIEAHTGKRFIAKAMKPDLDVTVVRPAPAPA